MFDFLNPITDLSLKCYWYTSLPRPRVPRSAFHIRNLWRTALNYDGEAQFPFKPYNSGQSANKYYFRPLCSNVFSLSPAARTYIAK